MCECLEKVVNKIDSASSVAPQRISFQLASNVFLICQLQVANLWVRLSHLVSRGTDKGKRMKFKSLSFIVNHIE